MYNRMVGRTASVISPFYSLLPGFALPYDYTIHALQTGTSFEKEICVWCTITAYTITFSEYILFKWSTRLQSMQNHMVGRPASVVSPFYFLLPMGYRSLFCILLLNFIFKNILFLTLEVHVNYNCSTEHSQ